jgi:hypothetical protein
MAKFAIIGVGNAYNCARNRQNRSGLGPLTWLPDNTINGFRVRRTRPLLLSGMNSTPGQLQRAVQKATASEAYARCCTRGTMTD